MEAKALYYILLTKTNEKKRAGNLPSYDASLCSVECSTLPILFNLFHPTATPRIDENIDLMTT